eukprot:5149175-Prymnesium_polylepis.1
MDTWKAYNAYDGEKPQHANAPRSDTKSKKPDSHKKSKNPFDRYVTRNRTESETSWHGNALAHQPMILR